MKKFVSVLLLVSLLASFTGCGFDEPHSVTLTAMGTVMEITVFNTSGGNKTEIADEMIQCITRLDKLWDTKDENSEISKINSADGDTKIQVSTDTAKIIAKGMGAYETTEYLFDIRVQPYVSLWGFDTGEYGVPDEEDIYVTRQIVNESNITVSQDYTWVRKTTGTQITLGGIAKGYLGDELSDIAIVDETCAMLSLGGNIVLCGNKPDGSLWSVGVKNPHNTESLACTFETKGDKSIVTSGGYERYFEYLGEEYHHIIDPVTGYPAESDLLSVTVIGRDGVACDYLSTALFIAGRKKAVEFAKKNNDFDFIFITENNKMFVTDGVKSLEPSAAFEVKLIDR